MAIDINVLISKDVSMFNEDRKEFFLTSKDNNGTLVKNEIIAISEPLDIYNRSLFVEVLLSDENLGILEVDSEMYISTIGNTDKVKRSIKGNRYFYEFDNFVKVTTNASGRGLLLVNNEKAIDSMTRVGGNGRSKVKEKLVGQEWFFKGDIHISLGRDESKPYESYLMYNPKLDLLLNKQKKELIQGVLMDTSISKEEVKLLKKKLGK